MLKYLIIFIVLAASIKIPASLKLKTICDLNPIYCQIIKNNPNIDSKYAMKLSNAIYYVAKLYDIDPRKYAAILAQESMYDLKATNHKTKDYGISQININTAKAYGFDTKRLTSDLAYSIEAGAIVLSDFKKTYADKEIHWWSRYNSGNPKKRKLYKIAVEKFL